MDDVPSKRRREDGSLEWDLSPEVDLLERLSADDAGLHESAHGGNEFRDLAHAKRVVSLYVKAGIVELYENQADSFTAIPFYTSRRILDDDSNWERDSKYSLRVTEEGYEKFVDDSEGFFDQLFS